MHHSRREVSAACFAVTPEEGNLIFIQAEDPLWARGSGDIDVDLVALVLPNGVPLWAPAREAGLSCWVALTSDTGLGASDRGETGRPAGCVDLPWMLMSGHLWRAMTGDVRRRSCFLIYRAPDPYSVEIVDKAGFDLYRQMGGVSSGAATGQSEGCRLPSCTRCGARR